MWTEKIKRSKNIPWQQIDEQALILQPSTGKAHELNHTALWFWKRFDGEKNLDSLFADFCSDYSCDSQTARTDIENMISQMRTLGIIE